MGPVRHIHGVAPAPDETRCGQGQSDMGDNAEIVGSSSDGAEEIKVMSCVSIRDNSRRNNDLRYVIERGYAR